MRRREFVRLAMGTGAAMAAAPSLLFARESPVKMTVYKTPGCDCCNAWVAYMKAQGFSVTAINVPDLTDVKRSSGVPPRLESCHTALVGAYVIEGHVPADLVRKVLAEKPAIVGLTVPGMPVDAPGMGNGKTPYSVVAWDRAGTAKVYARR